MKSKELRAQRAKLIEDARALIDADGSDEAAAKFDEMMAEANKLKGQVDRIETAEAAFAATMEAQRARGDREGISADEVAERQAAERGTFVAYLRAGVSGMNDEQREIYQRRFQAAQGTSPDTAGGYTVPMGPMQQLVEAQKAYGGVVEVANIIDTDGGNPLPIPTTNDTSNSGAILGENTQVSGQDVTFGSVTLNAYTYTSKLVLVSNQLLQDSAFDLSANLMRWLGTRIARGVNTDLTTGNGASKPTGVITGATLGYTAGGSTTSGETANILSDDLLELEHSVDPAYRRNASFMLSDAALKVIKKLKDGQGRPLWLSGIAVKEPDTINGYPYIVNQDMAAPAASAKPVLFGDFMNYYVRRVTGVQVMRLVERYADYNQTGFVAFQRWDGNLVDAGQHPVKYLQNSAS